MHCNYCLSGTISELNLYWSTNKWSKSIHFLIFVMSNLVNKVSAAPIFCGMFRRAVCRYLHTEPLQPHMFSNERTCNYYRHTRNLGIWTLSKNFNLGWIQRSLKLTLSIESIPLICLSCLSNSSTLSLVSLSKRHESLHWISSWWSKWGGGGYGMLI